MSPLTKILVILVVLLTLIQTAATVVFVNRVTLTETSYTNEHDLRTAGEAKVSALQAELANAQAAVNVARNQAQSQVGSQQQEVLRLQQQLADANVRNAESNSRLGLMSVDNARLTETLKASEDTKNKLADTVTQTRSINDDLSKKNADLNAAVADLTNRLDTTERDRRFVTEQLTELQGRGTTAPASPGSMNNAGNGAMPAAASSAPAINGTVKSVRTLSNNKPYATLSVGTADRVAPGMQFKVLDATGNFLGFVTVDTAEANESVGAITGPRVSDIKTGDQASTQLQ